MRQSNKVLTVAKIIRSCSLTVLFISSLAYLNLIPLVKIPEVFILQYSQQILLASAIIILLVILASLVIRYHAAKQTEDDYSLLLSESKTIIADTMRKHSTLSSKIQELETSVSVELGKGPSDLRAGLAEMKMYQGEIRNTYIRFIDKHITGIDRLHSIAKNILTNNKEVEEVFSKWERLC